jgi:Replication-relaxation
MDNESVTRQERFVPNAKRRIRLTARDLEIVKAIARFGAVSSGQIQEIFDMGQSRGNRVLRRLYDAGFLMRFTPTLSGVVAYDAQIIYTLGKASCTWVQEWKSCSLEEAKRRCSGERTPTYLAHTLSVVELYLEMKQGLSKLSDWTLRTFLVESECYDELVFQEGGRRHETGTRTVEIRPDAVAILRHEPTGTLRGFILESDLNNVRNKSLSAKLAGYCLYQQSGALGEAYSGVVSFQVLIVTGTTSRVESIREECLKVVTPDLFLVAKRDALNQQGFFAPVWGAGDMFSG